MVGINYPCAIYHANLKKLIIIIILLLLKIYKTY